MADWLESGHLIEAILALTAVEWLAVFAYHRRTGRGVEPGDIALNLVSGMFLLLALREALVGAWWGWVSVSLMGALVAHLADLRQRWRH